MINFLSSHQSHLPSGLHDADRLSERAEGICRGDIIPLEWGGAYDASDMQWQTVQEAKNRKTDLKEIADASEFHEEATIPLVFP